MRRARKTWVGMFPHAMVVDERHSRAFVINEAAPWRRMGDSVSVLDTRTGRERRRIGLAGPFSMLASDHVTGHVFLDLPNGGASGIPTSRLQVLDGVRQLVLRGTAIGH